MRDENAKSNDVKYKQRNVAKESRASKAESVKRGRKKTWGFEVSLPTASRRSDMMITIRFMISGYALMKVVAC